MKWQWRNKWLYVFKIWYEFWRFLLGEITSRGGPICRCSILPVPFYLTRIYCAVSLFLWSDWRIIVGRFAVEFRAEAWTRAATRIGSARCYTRTVDNIMESTNINLGTGSWAVVLSNIRSSGKNWSANFLSLHIVWYYADRVQQFYCCICTRCLRKGFIEPLPSNNVRGIHWHRENKVISKASF